MGGNKDDVFVHLRSGAITRGNKIIYYLSNYHRNNTFELLYNIEIGTLFLISGSECYIIPPGDGNEIPSFKRYFAVESYSRLSNTIKADYVLPSLEFIRSRQDARARPD